MSYCILPISFLDTIEVNMLIGYMRVSKADGSQVLDMQKDALLSAGVSPDRMYEDLASGKFNDRPGLINCLKALQPGNTLVVWKLDRLGRSLKDLVNIIEELNSKNIGFRVLSGQGASIDTTSSHGKLVFGIFAALAEFERELIIERTKAGLAAARARGKLGGRKRKVDSATLQLLSAAMSNNNTNAKELAKRLGISKSILYHYVNGDGSLKEAGKLIIEKN